jgi:DNA-binding NarL/FixJ family response regulator
MKAESMRAPQIGITLLEDDPLRLVGFRSILDRVPEFRVNAKSLPEIVAGGGDDVTLLGNHSARFFDTMAQLKGSLPHLRIVVTGMGMDDESILKAMVYGAKGYFDERGAPTDLVEAIRAVSQGSIWAPRRVVSMFIERAGDSLRNHQDRSSHLTCREKEVLKMLVEGRSNKEIGRPLGIEERTVKAHVAKLMRKVGVRNRISLSVQAIKYSLVSAQ